MKRALITCSVASFLNFELNDMKILQSLGYEVYVATNFGSGEDSYKDINQKLRKALEESGITTIQIDFARTPFSIRHLKTYRNLKYIINDKGISLIHCHTPVAGVLTRMAAKSIRKNNIKVIYTAHGFHFFDGAPIINWLVFYPIEKLCSRWTDILITINNEDYERAKKEFKARKVVKIPGVGIDIKKFSICNTNREKNSNFLNLQLRSKYRAEMNIPQNAFVMISVGEINNNKNYRVIIESLAKSKDELIHYVIVGRGALMSKLKELSCRLNVDKQIHFLGYRTDVAELYKMADIFCFPSKREGLGMAAIEAMASGLPIISSRIGGIKDYLIDNVTGCVCDIRSAEDICNKIVNVKRDSNYRIMLGKNAIEKSKEFDISKTEIIMKAVYTNI